jgi:hypothetical protein
MSRPPVFQRLPGRAQAPLKKNFGTHVIKLDIAPKTYPLGQHLFISASNNMFYRPSQWDKRHTICVVNLMPHETIILLLNSSCLGSNLQPTVGVSDTLPMCHICLVLKHWNWIYLELNIFLALILYLPDDVYCPVLYLPKSVFCYTSPLKRLTLSSRNNCCEVHQAFI